MKLDERRRKKKKWEGTQLDEGVGGMMEGEVKCKIILK